MKTRNLTNNDAPPLAWANITTGNGPSPFFGNAINASTLIVEFL